MQRTRRTVKQWWTQQPFRSNPFINWQWYTLILKDLFKYLLVVLWRQVPSMSMLDTERNTFENPAYEAREEVASSSSETVSSAPGGTNKVNKQKSLSAAFCCFAFITSLKKKFFIWTYSGLLSRVFPSSGEHWKSVVCGRSSCCEWAHEDCERTCCWRQGLLFHTHSMFSDARVRRLDFPLQRPQVRFRYFFLWWCSS